MISQEEMDEYSYKERKKMDKECKKKKMTRTEAYKALGEIDNRVDAGKITKKQHNKETKKVLKQFEERSECLRPMNHKSRAAMRMEC